MKSLVDFINEAQFENELESQYLKESEESVKSEKDFRDYAKNKFKEVYGDELDEDEMKKIIDGIVEKCDGDWGEAVGMLNKSFGS